MYSWLSRRRLEVGVSAVECVAIWKSLGIYTDSDEKAVERFLEVFNDETFLPGASILFDLSPKGSLTVAFSKDDIISETGKAKIDNKLLAEAVLGSTTII
ncbi:unnamed protein product [Eruca vesicaria subsp. sativa]|uniref:Chalcone-flavonone isomerase family protein n=1 Tax=Eruca vesicaria subsp. sativa TaxID=29727 RepID=A0ABC8LE38_ERUVS|nr:unnamed protein product [Eruca vesicaria subsp. sativa]